MGPERLIQEALESAGDPAGAFLWRRVCRDLDGEVRIGVVARDEAVTSRTIRALTRIENVEWIPLRLEPSGDSLHPTLGAIDRLLSIHALVWATPATAPLGAEERAGMTTIVAAGAPTQRVVVLADTELLARMTDDPEGEIADVLDRARTLCGDDWGVHPLGGHSDPVLDWVHTLQADQIGLARERRRAVATLLLREARQRAEQAIAVAGEEVGRVESLLAAEDERLDAERRKGRRTAAHLLGAMRRHTERLLVDLRTFLNTLEGDLATQVEAVNDVDTVRHTLPHWLHHIVEQWMSNRLSTWRVEVLSDLTDLNLATADLDRAELLVPALHTAPVRTESGWTQRLGVTAAVGSGAALLAFGMWIPGLLAVSGGLAWSAFGRRAAQASTLRALTQAATDAVRQMGQDADRLLRDQIATLENELERLGEDRASELGRAREAQRRQLDHERMIRRQKLVGLEEVLTGLDRRIAAMDAEPA